MPRIDAEASRSISILDPIGEDVWSGQGVTAKGVAGKLAEFGPGPITVSINSPGGNMFEGLAIYSLLREHDGDVSVKILGLAASAASVIAMAGQNVRIARAGFVMIHNAWVLATGNRHDLRQLADELEPFDANMAEIYAQRTGMPVADVAQRMDAETWLQGTTAIEQGFADELLDSDASTTTSASMRDRTAAKALESCFRDCGVDPAEFSALLARPSVEETAALAAGLSTFTNH